MFSKIVVTLVISLLLFGCASRKSQLDQKYDLVSKEAEGMQNELKATVNAQNAAEDRLKADKQLKKKLDKLMSIREHNASQDIPLAPDVDPSAEPAALVERLKKNFDHLSDRVSALKKEKAKIAEEQMLLNKH